MKNLFIILFIISGVTAAKAQGLYDYSKFDIGVAASVIKPYTDAQKNNTTGSGLLTIAYNSNPFISVVTDFQAGRFTGTSNYLSYYSSNYQTTFFSADLRLQVRAGQFFDYPNSRFFSAFRNVYLSSGIGYLYNVTTYNDSYTYYGGTINSTTTGHHRSAFVPIRLGYEYAIRNRYDNEPFIKIDVAYQYNHTFNDDLDGYSGGKNYDDFGQIILGVKLQIPGNANYHRTAQ